MVCERKDQIRYNSLGIGRVQLACGLKNANVTINSAPTSRESIRYLNYANYHFVRPYNLFEAVYINAN